MTLGPLKRAINANCPGHSNYWDYAAERQAEIKAQDIAESSMEGIVELKLNVKVAVLC